MKIRKKAQSAGLVATVVDNLTSTSAKDALSAKQGKALNEGKIDKSKAYNGDLNDINDTCFLYCNACTNRPKENGYLFTQKYTDNYLVQTYKSYDGSGSYIRVKNNGTWSDWMTISMSKVLYDNSSGTNGTVTLSESAANFNYLEVFFGRANTTESHEKNSTKIVSPNGKKASLVSAFYGDDIGIFQIRSRVININGTSITNVKDGYVNLTSTGVMSIGDEDCGYIYRVVGYK